VNSAICRDLLTYALLDCERAGLDVRFSVHDELVVVARDEDAEAVQQKLQEIMTRVPEWLAGMPLKAEARK
jgi:hypothetical protein